MFCTDCTSFTTDLLNLDFGNGRWVRHRQGESRDHFVRHAYRAIDGELHMKKLGLVRELKARAKRGCRLCAVMLETARPPATETSLEDQTWVTIQFNPFVKSATFEFDINNVEDSRCGLEFFTKDVKFTFNGIGLRRSIDRSATSERCINLIKGWIQRCANKHDMCKRGFPTALPTRVIDVGPLDGSQEPFLYASNGDCDTYLTLSHSWGKKDRLLTTMNNLQDHQARLPLLALPYTFQDAILMTRMLGFRYLWIDCYCIIQDSIDDWQIEAARMADVYANSFLTISALDGEDSHSGLFADRDHCFGVQPIWENYVPTSRERLETGIRPETPSFSDVLHSSHLTSRAWVMQERTLSVAVLHFSSSGLYWECASCTFSESRHIASREQDPCRTTIRSTQARLAEPGRFVGASTQPWYELVEDYSRKALSFETDIIPALSGITAVGERQTGSNCLAGLWEADLPKGLIWHGPRRTLKRPKAPDLAPSWSWASVVGGVGYTWGAGDSLGRRIASDLELSVVSASISNPVLGGKCSGRILLWGQLKRVYYQLDRLILADAGIGALSKVKVAIPEFRRTRRKGNSQRCNHSVQVVLERQRPPLPPPPPPAAPPPRRRAFITMADINSLVNRDDLPNATMDFDTSTARYVYCLRVAEFEMIDRRDDDAAGEQAYRGRSARTTSFYLILERKSKHRRKQKRSSGLPHSFDYGTFVRVGMGGARPDEVDGFFKGARKVFLTLV